MAKPLVSCIMPTYNRRKFVPLAIHYFLRQDYPCRELIVVDDGTDAVRDLLPTDERIRYIRLEEKLTIGAKRNLACELAAGEIIVHWDDDDWMANRRVSYQAGQLGEADICGLGRVICFDPVAEAAWEYVFPGTIKPWVYGATLCYRKAFWRKNPFPDRDVGEDLRFIWRDMEAKIAVIPDNRIIAALVHPGNTSAKRTDDACWFDMPISEIRALLGEDWAYYQEPRRTRSRAGRTSVRRP